MEYTNINKVEIFHVLGLEILGSRQDKVALPRRRHSEHGTRSYMQR